MVSSILQCPCHAWQDGRDDPVSRVVREQNSGDVWLSHDANKDLRAKLGALAVFTIPWGIVFRAPTRIFELIFSTWGKAQVETDETFYQRSHTWIQNGRIPSQQPVKWKIALSTHLLLIAEQIVKLITLPLSWIALTFAALWGLINPLDGRRLYGLIEKMWAIPGSLEMSPDYVRAVNYLAICMQPVNVWDQENLYRCTPFYHPDTLRSLSLEAKTAIKRATPYMDVSGLIEEHREIEDKIRTNCPTDREDRLGIGLPQSLEEREELRTRLENLTQQIYEAIALRKQLVLAAHDQNEEEFATLSNMILPTERIR